MQWKRSSRSFTKSFSSQELEWITRLRKHLKELILPLASFNEVFDPGSDNSVESLHGTRLTVLEGPGVQWTPAPSPHPASACFTRRMSLPSCWMLIGHNWRVKSWGVITVIKAIKPPVDSVLLAVQNRWSCLTCRRPAATLTLALTLRAADSSLASRLSGS